MIAVEAVEEEDVDVEGEGGGSCFVCIVMKIVDKCVILNEGEESERAD